MGGAPPALPGPSLRSGCRDDGRRPAAEAALELMDEVAEAREAAVEAGIRDRGAVEEHAARDVEPHLDEILMRRPPGELAEDARKLEGTHGHRRGDRKSVV